VALAGVAIYFWPERHFRQARIALASRDYRLARQRLERYLEARPDKAEAHLLLARLDRRMNDYAEFTRHLAACQRLGGRADAIELERGLSAIQEGVYNPELDKLCSENLARADAEEQFVILEALSQGLTKTYRIKEALVCLDRMLDLQPDSTYALRRRAWVCMQLQQHDQAEKDYRHALDIDPEDGAARLGLAQILESVRKNHAEAAEHFEQLWNKEKTAAVALGLAQAWRQIGRAPEAAHLLDSWLTEHPGDALALAERGRLAVEGQAGEQGEQMLRRAVALAPYQFDAYYTLYLYLNRQGRTAEAKECEARMQKAREEGKATMGQLSELMKKLQSTPDDADLRCQIGQLFLRNGEEEGLRWLLLNVQNHPDHRPSHLALADYYEKSRQPTLAAEHRRRAGQEPAVTGAAH
jgi:tetratricopeptide (TPR) repeat protein